MSFLISFTVIIILGISAYIDFVEIRKELGYLELADSIRSKSLQLRRHEKNFLQGDFKEADDVHSYLAQLKDLVREGSPAGKPDRTLEILDRKIDEYRNNFERIVGIASNIMDILKDSKSRKSPYAFILHFVESTFLQHPLEGAELLKKTSLASEDRAIKALRSLAHEIDSLRGLGEDILLLSKDIDKSARSRVEDLISVSKRSGLILIPASFFIGLFLLFVIKPGCGESVKGVNGDRRKNREGLFFSDTHPCATG